MRVAALIDTYEVFGAGRQLAPIGPALRARGVQQQVILFQRQGRPPSPYAAYLSALGAEHVVLPESGPTDVRVLRRVSDALATFDPDIVETHGYRTSAIVTALRAIGPRRWRWVAFFHGTTTENAKVRAYNWIDRRLMRRADRLVVMSQAHRAACAPLGDRVRVVYNAVLELPAIPEAPPVDLPGGFAEARSNGAVLLGVVGRLSSEKGVDVFLDACGVLANRDVPFRALIAGDGPDRQMLTARARTLGLADRVAFLGNVCDMGRLYRQIDCLVIPSRSEGLPNVLLEALNHDLPAVATHVGAIPEVLTDQRAGIVVPPQQPDALADGIRRALPLMRDPAAQAARAAAAQRFSLAARVDAHLALYDELVTLSPTPPSGAGSGVARRAA